MCVGFLNGEGNRAFASRALVAVPFDGNLSDWLQ